MTATFYVGDAIEVMNKLPEKSVDLILTSPPFLALRSYLPADHPDKALEGGSQATPGMFIDWLIDVVEACDRVLAPHGSLCIELGDTYAGSGGAGGDYDPGGFRDGQPGFRGSGRTRSGRVPDSYDVDTNEKYERIRGDGFKQGVVNLDEKKQGGGTGWPLAKSLSLIPELFRLTLVYGTNPLTGRQTERWRLRNVVRWVRPNPPVGALGDKFRPATSELMVFCKSAKRYFDLDSVRGEVSEWTKGYADRPVPISANASASNTQSMGSGTRTSGLAHEAKPVNQQGAPPLDWWNIPLLEGETPTKGGPKAKDRSNENWTHPIHDPRDERFLKEPSGQNPAGAPPLDWWNIPLLEGEEETRYGPGEKERLKVESEARRPRVRGLKDDGYGSRASTDSGNNPLGTPPLDWWNIPPGGYVTWPERVNPGEYVDGTLYIASAGCPLHEGLSGPVATAPHDEPLETPSSHSSDTDSRPAPKWQAGSVPTDQPTLLNLEDGSSDSPNPEPPPAAKRRSKASNRTAPAPATSPPDTASDKTPDRTDDTSTEPLSDVPHPDSPENRTSAARQAFLALESYARTGHKTAELEACTCSFYIGNTDSTSHYAIKPKRQRKEGERSGTGPKTLNASKDGTGWAWERTLIQNPLGAPPLDWWEIPPGGYQGSHYAVFPPELCIKPIKAMCPEKVCRQCGEPSRRIVGEAEYVARGKPAALKFREGVRPAPGVNQWQGFGKDNSATRVAPTLGFSDCGHDNWRPGLVLDPFGGSGTTALVATGHGRDAILIDLDERNYDLALERVGPFILQKGAL